MKFLTAVACIAITASSFAQAGHDGDAQQASTLQALEIGRMVGLDQSMTDQLAKSMMASSKETTDLVAKCAEIQLQIDEVYQKNMESVVAKLDASQKERYMAAVKEGRIKFGPCAVNGGSCATGAKSGDAKAAGCCAGKAQTEAKPACCADGKGHTEAKPADKAAPEKK